MRCNLFASGVRRLLRSKDLEIYFQTAHSRYAIREMELAKRTTYCESVSATLGSCEYQTIEPTFPLSQDPEFLRWSTQLEALSAAVVSIREANQTAEDGRRMKDLQVVCCPISVRSVRENVSTIIERQVHIAEIDGVHVGFCVSSQGPKDSDPLFFQIVAVAPVAPDAQRRGVGLSMFGAATAREPLRDIALATQDDNIAARSLNEKFARTIGATIQRVTLGTYRDRDLGIQRGLGYRAWIVRRPTAQSE